jgi:hypothetical protein
MNELYPIIRRKRRVLTDTQPPVTAVLVVPAVPVVPVNPPVVTVDPVTASSATVPPKKSRDDVSKN